MKRFFITTVSMIMLIIVLAACSTSADKARLSTNEGKEAGSEASGRDADSKKENEASTDESTKDEAVKNEEQSVKDTADSKNEDVDSSITTLDVRMAGEVGENVHLSWKTIGSENGSGIEVCRSATGNDDFEVIATITEDDNGYFKDGYIDQGAAGKGYFYGVRITNGKAYGAIGQVLQAAPSEHSWYQSGSSYLCVIEQPEDPDYLIQFTEFDLTGNRTWNCDWPCMVNEDVYTWMEGDIEHTRTFQYRFTTPMEYDETNSELFIYYADMGANMFTLTMYTYDQELNLPMFDDTSYNKIN